MGLGHFWRFFSGFVLGILIAESSAVTRTMQDCGGFST
jgi:hypothetical protein